MARLAFLAGAGWPPARIANDPLICSTENAVRHKARVLEIEFRDAPADYVPHDVIGTFHEEGQRYHMSGRQLIETYLRAGAREPQMIHNVVDMEG